LTLKKQLSERILAAAQKSTVEPNREAILALSATFDISEENAAQVLADCNNDLRLAVKTIKLNELKGQ
jgi:predicted metal-binding transcription factor (methanogenesis marker protein 9)